MKVLSIRISFAWKYFVHDKDLVMPDFKID